MWMSIGDLAKRTGITVRTLRHYDQIGLLSPSSRSRNGYRRYSLADVTRLQKILALKQFGWSLSEIGVLLTDPEASSAEIISRQIKRLDEQIQQAQHLRDRLSLLQERLLNGAETDFSDWLAILELMTMFEKFFSKEERGLLRFNRTAGNLDQVWKHLVPRIQEAMDQGLAPESEKVQGLAWEWLRLLKKITGNNPILAQKLRTFHQTTKKPLFFKGVTSQMAEYLIQALVSAREGLLAKYLSSSQLDTVRRRLAAHGREWPTLISEIRQHMNQGISPRDPLIRSLSQRWTNLFRASFCGDDRDLEKKVKSAFKNEPGLWGGGVGLDSALMDFIGQALGLAGEQEHPRVDPGPKPSALRVAQLRAVHQILDRPLVFEDPLALAILGPAEEASLRSNPERFNLPLLRALRTSVVVRSRLAEDEWARSEKLGIRQYVILGAGLDTFAYRKKVPIDVRGFEVDLPACQQWKRNLLHAAGIDPPPWLAFVPFDFEQAEMRQAFHGKKTSAAPGGKKQPSGLSQALVRSGFDPDAPAFFSWLGVTLYLDQEAIWNTLGLVASLAPGTCILFDYGVLPSFLSAQERQVMEFLVLKAAERGEPWKTWFDPRELAQRLPGLGFREVEDFGPSLLNDRYLSGRSDGLRKSGVSRLALARV